MPNVWGLSKAAANYRAAQKPAIRCGECALMFPRTAIGGCRYVRGVIRPGDVCDEFVPRRAKGPAAGS
jgi:hypothetical protein